MNNWPKLLLILSSFTLNCFAQTSGSYDLSFNSTGKVIMNCGGTDDRCFSSVVQPDKKIVCLGTSVQGGLRTQTITRYNEDGSLDLSFGNNGLVLENVLNGSHNEVKKVLLQSNGRIVCLGNVWDPLVSESDMFIVRFLPSGNIDSTFGNNGKFIFGLPGVMYVVKPKCTFQSIT